MRSQKLALLLLLITVTAASITFIGHVPAHGNQIAVPSPADVLGFTPGDDRKLASWDQVLEYFRSLDQASDRVVFEELGKSTMGKPFVMATISSPANLAKLDEYKNIQEQL